MAETLSPVYKGDLSPWELAQTNADGSVRTLQGVDPDLITVKLQPVSPSGLSVTGKGSVSIPTATAAQGLLYYAPDPTDVASLGTFNLWLIASWVPGKPQHSKPYNFAIVDAP